MTTTSAIQPAGPSRCLPRHLATLFMAAIGKHSSLPLELITLLSQMALGPDRPRAKAATASLYGRIILPLCDDFSNQGVAAANQVLIAMIQTFCRTQAGRETRQLLRHFHLGTTESFLARHAELCHLHPLLTPSREAIKKVFILSRITLGADIAITSPIIYRVRQALPQADIVLVGPEHLLRLFAHEDLRHLEFPYDRQASLTDKMATWPRLFRLISRESRGLKSQELLLFDPDSRLSQLGLLPFIATASTFYLTSRQDQQEHTSLPAITNAWLDKIFPGSEPSVPQFRIRPALFAACRSFFKRQATDTLKIIINFGVGSDNNKRLAAPFEEELLAALLTNDKTLIILDSGTGDHEIHRAKRLVAKMTERGYKSGELSQGLFEAPEMAGRQGILRFTGAIDALAGLIACSNLFIGYDSCGQHLATATKTPAIICFCGAANKRFIERWHPSNHHGKTTTHIFRQRSLPPQKRAQCIAEIVHTADQYRP